MGMIRLSQIDDNDLTDEEIDCIVYSDIEDDKLSSQTVDKRNTQMKS